jgi:hypothetical protein
LLLSPLLLSSGRCVMMRHMRHIKVRQQVRKENIEMAEEFGGPQKSCRSNAKTCVTCVTCVTNRQKIDSDWSFANSGSLCLCPTCEFPFAFALSPLPFRLSPAHPLSARCVTMRHLRHSDTKKWGDKFPPLTPVVRA